MKKTDFKIQRDILTLAHRDFNKSLNVHAFFKVNNHATGEDLVQETFLKTWKYLIKGGKIDIIKAFLYHILNNLIIDEYRKHKATSLDALTEKGFEPGVIDGESERLVDKIDAKSASLLIQKLPLAYIKIMKMRFIQDLSINEIATLTGLTKNAITVKIHRGLQKMKVLYGQKVMVN